MKRINIIILVSVFLLVGLVYAGELGDIGTGDIEKNITPTKPGIIKSMPVELTTNKIVQIEVDPYINCPVENNQIVCYPMTPEQKSNLSASLGLIDKTEMFLFGIPIKDGGLTSKSYINPDLKTIINIDLSKTGTIEIGFHTNSYEIYSIANGIYNNTFPSSSPAKLYLSGNNLTGEWYSPIGDLNLSQQISNISYVSTEPTVSDVTTYVRTNNLTNGATTGLYQDLFGFWKFDDGALKDYSSKNLTGASSGADASFIAEGRYGAGTFYGEAQANDGIQIVSSGVTDFNANRNYTFSLWFKKDMVDQPATTYLLDRRGTRHVTYATITSGDALSVGFYNSANSVSKTLASSAISNTNWHHLVGGYNGSAYIYVDGAYVSGSTAFDTGNGTGELVVGKTFTDTSEFNGSIDEVGWWNRSLTATEISTLYSSEFIPWSSYSSECNTGACSVSVTDGRYVQVRSDLSRSAGENVYLESVSVGYTDPGSTPPAVDNPPESTLTLDDGINFGYVNVTLNGTQTDYKMLVNASIWTNTTGVWHRNQTQWINGTLNSTSFLINNTLQGTYKYNIYVCDNSSQCSWANANKTFIVALSCNDADCTGGFVCNDETTTCYTSCNAHSQCNNTYYCGSGGSCSPAELNTTSCANKEWSGLSDNEDCISQLTGWCYNDNVGTVGEFCTNTQASCVDNEVIYAQGKYICSSGDAYQCGSGVDTSTPWTQTPCKDGTEPAYQNATYHVGGYCGYYNPETCIGGGGDTGCQPAVPATSDCGNFYYTGSSCGTGASSCDEGCGASYDLDSCPVGLSSDCNTCAGSPIDDPPEVTLVTPVQGSTQTTTSISFGYKLFEDSKLENCSFYFMTGTIPWHLNQTNSSAIVRDGLTTNYFYQDLTDGDSVTWNIYCLDNSTQNDWGDTNFTFTINTAYQGTFKPLIVYNGSEATAEVFSIDENGNTFIKGNIIVNTSTSSLNLSYLGLSGYMDYEASPLTGVRVNNPYSNYLKFLGKTGEDLLINLAGDNPQITTESGDRVKFGKMIEGSSLNITSNSYMKYINSLDQPLYIGREYELGGITIQNGEIFAQNITLASGYLLSSGVIMNGSFIPSENDLFDMGNSSLKWRHGFFRDLNVSSEVYINGVSVSPWLFNQTTLTNLQNLLNSTGVYSTYNATYDAKQSSLWVTNGTNIYNATVNATGIGNDFPLRNLDVAGTMNTYMRVTTLNTGGSAGTQTGIEFYQNKTSNAYTMGQIYTVPGGGYTTPVMYFSVADSAKVLQWRMNINKDGNIGIGTTAQTSRLDVNGTLNIWSDTSATDAIQKFSINGNTDSWILNRTSYTGGGSEYDFGIMYTRIGATQGDFFIGNTTNRNLVIAKTGNVGIGTISPNALLTVNGNANLSGMLYSNYTNVGIGLKNPNNTLEILGDIKVKGVDVTTSPAKDFIFQTGGDFSSIIPGSGGDMLFSTGSGNVPDNDAGGSGGLVSWILGNGGDGTNNAGGNGGYYNIITGNGGQGNSDGGGLGGDASWILGNGGDSDTVSGGKGGSFVVTTGDGGISGGDDPNANGGDFSITTGTGEYGGNILFNLGTGDTGDGVFKITNLGGTGNDYVCVDSTGALFRSNTACA